MAVIDFKEYTRMRDIAVKRSKRLAAAGLAPAIHIPTVREIRSGVTSGPEALRQLDIYLSSGSTVTAVRQTGIVPEFRKFVELPPKPKLSEAEKKERKREQGRLYRQRKRVREVALTKEKRKKYEGYLKALETVSKTWKRAGFDIGIDLKHLSPSQAQAFVEYMDFRFSQGDFTQRYVIDEFVQDFSKLLSRGYKGSEITDDFNKFLADRKMLDDRASAMEGMSSGEIMAMWSRFAGRD